MNRHCPHCGGKITVKASRGGIPQRVCENGPHGILDFLLTLEKKGYVRRVDPPLRTKGGRQRWDVELPGSDLGH